MTNGWLGGYLIKRSESLPAVWRPDGTISIATGLSNVLAVNSNGLALGMSDDQSTVLLWRAGKVVGSLTDSYPDVLTQRIGDDGSVPGVYYGPDGVGLPAVWRTGHH